MIKGIVNEKTLILGLSRENVTRLMDNQPIMIDAAALPGPGHLGTVEKIIIMGGETEEAMVESLRSVSHVQDGEHGLFTQPGEGKRDRQD